MHVDMTALVCPRTVLIEFRTWQCAALVVVAKPMHVAVYLSVCLTDV
jgi:hypothetical protein